MILCITHSSDHYTIDLVHKRLKELGHEMFRFDSDRFGTDYLLEYELNDGPPQLCLKGPAGQIKVSQIDAVWYRKLWSLQKPESMDPSFSETYSRAYSTYRDIFFSYLANLPWMNDMDRDHAVGNNKLLQLEHAQASGLNVPRTIMSNDAARVLQFYDECGGEVVMKLHNSLGQSMKRAAFFPTTLLKKEHLQDAAGLRLCPMIFQQRIFKDYELRIAYVDGALFAGKIQVGEDGPGAIDWRASDPAAQGSRWAAYELPAGVTQSIKKFMRSLGLSFGAIDMIRNPEGDYVFLEVNPQGEWGMLQRDLGYPIAETIAEKIINKIINEKKDTHHHALER